jgi:hypothetical protein
MGMATGMEMGQGMGMVKLQHRQMAIKNPHLQRLSSRNPSIPLLLVSSLPPAPIKPHHLARLGKLVVRLNRVWGLQGFQVGCHLFRRIDSMIDWDVYIPAFTLLSYCIVYQVVSTLHLHLPTIERNCPVSPSHLSPDLLDLYPCYFSCTSLYP